MGHPTFYTKTVANDSPETGLESSGEECFWFSDNTEHGPFETMSEAVRDYVNTRWSDFLSEEIA